MSEEKLESKDEPKTIDDAIDACQSNIRWHRINAFVLLVLLVFVTYAFYRSFHYLELIGKEVNYGGSIDLEKIGEFAAKASLYPFIIFGLFLASFGIIVALYRLHVSEISRNEQLKIGFWRIRIAARNTDKGFLTEVRQSLTKDAFSPDTKTQGRKNKEVESPIPGHPASDLAATVLNKILENIEVNVSKKTKD